jgi:phosphatidylinositol alpha-1,6-mannosyltransferase
MGKGLFEFSARFNKRLMIWSMHDAVNDACENEYFPNEQYRAFGGSKLHFVRAAAEQGMRSKVVILSHINLLPVGWLIKKIRPGVQLVLLSHGIEIWSGLSSSKKKMLSVVDEFWAVSRFTARCIEERHGIDARKIKVLNNCLDPFLPLLKNVVVPPGLLSGYGIKADDKVLLTIARLSSTEKYKGYDDVLKAIAGLKDQRIKYILAGKADEPERKRLEKMVAELGLQWQVIIPGFIAEETLAAHFTSCDCYIMPSSKEGFGIVFIEAMHYGAPVIGGNVDGSTDALKDGQLGLLVRPGHIEGIQEAISLVLNDAETYRPNKDLLEASFSYEAYKNRLNTLLLHCYDGGEKSMTANLSIRNTPASAATLYKND